MGERVRIDAYVVSADAPADRLLAWREEVTVGYRRADGRLIGATTKTRIPEERWLVRGMTVPAVVDTDHPGEIEILFGEVPSLEQRVAANDPPLCELERVSREVKRVRDQLEPVPDADAAARAQMVEIQIRNLEAEHAAALATRPAAPVTGYDGSLRGTADAVSFTPRPIGDGGPDSAGRSWHGKRIVRIWLYGYAPYPVLEDVKFSSRDPRTWLAHGRVPVSVSPTDRTDVEYLWDEYDLDERKAARERMDREIGRAASDIKAVQDHFGPAMLEQAMAACHDIGQRRVLAEQMRAMGHEVPDHFLRDSERLAKLDALLARGVISQAEYDEQAARC